VASAPIVRAAQPFVDSCYPAGQHESLIATIKAEDPDGQHFTEPHRARGRSGVALAAAAFSGTLGTLVARHLVANYGVRNL